jgi:hypothetical protein
MTSELRVDNLKGSTTGGSINVLGEGTSATTNLQQGLIKSFINHDSGATINDSFNVSTLTDNATGEHRHLFTNLHGNNNYAVSGATMGDETTQSEGFTYTFITGASSFGNSRHRTSELSYNIVHHAGTLRDTQMVQVKTSGDLA